jgi:ABC-2 type transport system ATP-binding protein
MEQSGDTSGSPAQARAAAPGGSARPARPTRARVPACSWTMGERPAMTRGAVPRSGKIFIDGLSKEYGELRALDSVSFEIEAGEVFGVLGPNGAGKTTLIRTLMGLSIASSGHASILGMDSFTDRVELKRHIGYLADVPFFYDYLTGHELLRFMAEMHRLPSGQAAERAERLLAELQLTDAANDFVTSYSLGMKKKMGLALALLHEPTVLILDEPTTGLDPHSSLQVRQLIRRYADSGRTVLLSTHWLDMAESVCDRVGIIHHGRLVANGTPAALRAQADAESGERRLEDVFFQLTREGEAGHVPSPLRPEQLGIDEI